MKTTSIRTMKQVFSKLRRHAKTDYRLLILCNLIANLLVSAFSFLIWSSTVQKTFPPGGDSMKQVMMVFCIAIFGCLVFTVYAAMLFFRYKSREIGVFMALGTGKRSLAGQLFRELFASMAFPALTGIILGPLFTLGIWQIFRLFLSDKEGTVAMSNRQVYEDLTRLGAGNEFRFRSVREQLSKICSLPTILGMTAITLFFLMILFANDGRISLSEGTGVGVCVLIMMFFGAGIFLFYLRTLKVVCRMLGISAKSVSEKRL